MERKGLIKMQIESAIRLVDGVIFWPGWEFEATDHTKRFEGTICVKVTYPARETSRERALEGYPEENRPYASFPLIVRDLDDAGLYRALMWAVGKIREHEDREALRIQPTGWAPFHPHQVDGMRRWHESERCLMESLEILSDLQFGLS